MPTKLTKANLMTHVRPPAGVRKTARKGGAKHKKGGFAPAIAAALPFLLAGTAPILSRLGNAVAKKIGLGRGVIRAGAVRTGRTTGGYIRRR